MLLVIKLLAVFGALYVTQSVRIDVATLANGATCTASSSLPGNECEKALDSKETPVTHEFVSARDFMDSYIHISFKNATIIDEVRFLQRCNFPDQTREVRVNFDDGSSQLVTLDCNGNIDAENCEGVHWESQLLSPRVARSVNISTVSVCSAGGFTGWREVSVMGEVISIAESEDTNIALAKQGGTCEASSYESDLSVCDFVLDEVIHQNNSWSSAPGDTINAWLYVSLPGESIVSELRLLQGCQQENRMSSIRVDYDGGSSVQYSLECFDNTTCSNNRWNELVIPNIRTSSVNISCLTTCVPGTNQIELREVQVIGQTESDQACPFDFDHNDQIGSCYKFITDQPTTIEEAKAACAALYPSAHLVEIQSQAEQDYLARKAESLRLVNGVSCASYYINMYEAPNGTWLWNSTGSQVLLPYWSFDVLKEKTEGVKEGDSYGVHAKDTKDAAEKNFMTTAYFVVTGPPPPSGQFAAMWFQTGAGPYQQWTWATLMGSENTCFVCEALAR